MTPPVTPQLAEEARLGQQVFELQVKPRLSPADDGKFVALDMDTGDYVVDADDYTATSKLRSRSPRARIWLARAGQPTAYRMGSRSLSGER